LLEFLSDLIGLTTFKNLNATDKGLVQGEVWLDPFSFSFFPPGWPLSFCCHLGFFSGVSPFWES
jgi:hypothetical protein